MLILTRKLNEKLIINDNIEIVILDSYKNAVKLGINAPSSVSVYREEIYQEIKKSNKQAQSTEISTISSLSANKKQDYSLLKKIRHNDN